MSEKKKTFTKICENCGEQFRAFYEKRRFCCMGCFQNFKTGKSLEEIYGVKKSKEIKEKISKSLTVVSLFVTLKCKECKKEFTVKDYKCNKNKVFCSKECRDKFVKGKTFEELFGKEKAEEIGSRISSKVLGRKNPSPDIPGCDKHAIKILEQTKILEKQGYRAIPLYKTFPDIVAIQGDNIKVFAVEVEVEKPKNRMRLNKYDINKTKKYYDDIIWIIIKKEKKNVK